MADYSLGLYTSVIDGEGEIGEITSLVTNWDRIIRINGGYWQGSFSITNQPMSVLEDWLYTYLFNHIVERSGGGTTWEGYIKRMVLDKDVSPPVLDVNVWGYIRTANYRHVTVADSAGAASTYITAILASDCQLLSAGDIATNSMSVEQETNIPQRAWDEILRVVDLGDTSGNLWRAYVYNGRTLNYEQVSTTPLYYVRQGVSRVRDLDDMWNHISGKYIDATNEAQDLASTENADSIAKYGQKEYKILEDNVSSAVAAARRDTFLNEYQWSYPRPMFGGGEMEIVAVDGTDMLRVPWSMKPGVFRDLQYPVSGTKSSAWLSDRRDFIVDEIRVNADSGATLSTKFMLQSDVLKAQARRYGATGGGGGGGGSTKFGGSREDPEFLWPTGNDPDTGQAIWEPQDPNSYRKYKRRRGGG
jgi:hypothetical protein